MVIVEARFYGAGQELHRHQTLLADNVAIDGSDTRLKPGERRLFRVPIPESAERALVRVLHKRNRDLPDEQARILFEKEVQLP